jgi:alpha-glucosidase
MKNKIACFLFFTLLSVLSHAQTSRRYQLKSPDGKISINIEATPNLSWSVQHENTNVLLPSAISMKLQNGEELGKKTAVLSSKTTSANNVIQAHFYKKATVQDNCNQLEIAFKNNYRVLFRAYNDGVAYRFVTARKDSLVIANEEAQFNFSQDHNSFIPYVRDPRYGNDLFQTSFENLYDEKKLSQFDKDTLGFLPVLVQLDSSKKAVILEADLEAYPGLYVAPSPSSPNSLRAVFAPYPLEVKLAGNVGGRNAIVTKRAAYIARTAGTRAFPWRAVIISTQDKDLLNNDMVYKLAAPSRLADVSWIKPGKVAWDWWNDWNISHVDFRAANNTPTNKYKIYFAAAHGNENILMY